LAKSDAGRRPDRRASAPAASCPRAPSECETPARLASVLALLARQPIRVACDFVDAYRKPPRLPALETARQHGDERRAWSTAFLEYAYALVDEPTYAGMPCTRDDEGKLDWIIPTNRGPGSKNWDGNARRKKWWETKARSVGIPIEGKWISKTAKQIHPWGWKPCQTCGRWMRLSYSYPAARTVDALNRWLPDDEELDVVNYLDIYEVAEHSVGVLGERDAFLALSSALPPLRDRQPPTTLDGLLTVLEEGVVRAELRGRLSPGAMSNAPDRLDGFHTYNLCCRRKQDTGRSLDNLKTYGVDRRAFEHWSEGDWEAANLLMSRTTEGVCSRCGERRQLSADHVGPISLGFQHTPFFEAVCASCNSAKNNRMAMRDIDQLLALERDGTEVASWHATPLWSATKNGVHDDAAALRLSKLLNVNQHEFLRLLLRARAAGTPDILLQFLSPQYAEERVEFVDLDRATLQYRAILKRPRQATYSRSKAARLIRIAFEALDEYAVKEKRNVQAVPPNLLEEEIHGVDAALARAREDVSHWRGPLLEALDPDEPASVRENRLQELVGPGFYEPTHDYAYVRVVFERYMEKVGEILASRLDDDHAIKLWDEALGSEPAAS
jgi:Alw26I/Eco31I/Esp3I family type II restriction endonuclease